MGEQDTAQQADPGQLTDKQEDQRFQQDPNDPEMYLYVPSGVWYVRKKKKGKKQLFKSTGETRKGRARTRADEIIQEWLGKTPAQFQASQLLFREHAPRALADWLASGKYRSRTKENMQAFIAELVEEIGETPLSEITEGFIERWIGEFRTRKRRTIFRDYVSYIVKVMRHAKRNGYLVSVPEYENPDPKRKTGRAFTRKEMEALYSVAHGWLEAARAGRNRQLLLRRLQLVCQLKACFEGGLRLRECLQAPWSEVDLRTGRWIIPPERVKMGSKTAQGKDIFMPPSLLPLLRELRALYPVEGATWIFPNPRDPSRPIWANRTAWRALKREAGVLGRARWHDLRHTGLTWALLGDDEFQARLEAASPAEQEELRGQLANPLLVSKYWGTNMRTIEAVYLKVRAEHTREIARCIQVGRGEPLQAGEKAGRK